MFYFLLIEKLNAAWLTQIYIILPLIHQATMKRIISTQTSFVWHPRQLNQAS